MDLTNLPLTIGTWFFLVDRHTCFQWDYTHASGIPSFCAQLSMVFVLYACEIHNVTQVEYGYLSVFIDCWTYR